MKIQNDDTGENDFHSEEIANSETDIEENHRSDDNDEVDLEIYQQQV